MTEIYLSTNHLMLRSGYENPKMHSHSACHILISLCGEVQIILRDNTVTCRGALIPSGIEHTVNSNMPLLVFLFDSTTTVSEQIQTFQSLDEETVQRIVRAYEQYQKGGFLPQDYETYLLYVMEQIGLKGIDSKITDERITLAMHFVEEHIADNILIEDAARASFLSVSRFSHLFRQQTGITFAGYVVLRKLYRAYVELAHGAAITDAALSAGFSNPSHFATVSRKILGITARDICGEFEVHILPDFRPPVPKGYEV